MLYVNGAAAINNLTLRSTVVTAVGNGYVGSSSNRGGAAGQDAVNGQELASTGTGLLTALGGSTAGSISAAGVITAPVFALARNATAGSVYAALQALDNIGSRYVVSGGGATGTAAVAAGTNAFAAGVGASAGGAGAVSVGGNATAGSAAAATDAIAIGGQSSVVAAATSGVGIDRGATVSGAYGIALGDAAASGALGRNVAIGSGAIANSATAAGGAVAIGRANKATGDGAVALGDPTTATGQGAIAQGYNSVATADGTATGGAANGAVALGNTAIAAGQGSVSIGNLTQANTAGSVAVGDGALVAAAATKGVALGTGASASVANAVALGAGATTTVGTNTTGATIGGTAYTFAGTAPATAGVVSLGSAGAERQIQNVAAGRLSATSTDAVNGSQVFATNTQVTADTAGLTNLVGVLGGTYTPSTGAYVGPTYTTAGGTTATTVQGAFTNYNASIAAIQGGSTGPVQRTATTNQLALVASGGSGAAPGAAQVLTNVAAGSVTAGATEATNGGELYSAGSGVLAALGGSTAGSISAAGVVTAPVFALSRNATAGTVYAGLQALDTIGSRYVVSGGGATGTAAAATGTNAFAAGVGASASTANGVALGAGAVTTTGVNVTGATISGTAYTFAGTAPATAGVVSLGSAGAERQIQNVAAGRLSATSTDAVNGSQVFATNTQVTADTAGLTNLVGVLGGTYTPSTGAYVGPTYTTAGGTTATTVQGAFTNYNASIANLENGGSGPVQYSSAGAPTTPNGGTKSNDVTLVGAAAGPVALHNVAAGAVSATSANAVTGAQLDATNQNVAGNTSAITTIQNGGGTKFAVTNSTGPAASASGAGATALGGNATAGASAAAPDALAIGGEASVAAGATSGVGIGRGAQVTGAYGVALGDGASASTANGVALGAGAVTTAGVNTAGATIGGTAYTFAGTTPVGVVSVGAPGAERQIRNVAAGRLSATSTDAVNGSQVFATNTQVAANTTGVTNLVGVLGGTYTPSTGAYTAPTYTVAGGTTATTVQGAFTTYNTAIANLENGGSGPVQYSSAGAPTTPNGGTKSNDVTLVGAAAGPVALHNVAAGAVSATSADAVTGAQLDATNQNVAGNTSAITTIQNGGGTKFAVTNSTGPAASASGAGATALGGNATAGASAAAPDALAIGGEASVAAGATSGVGIGRGAQVTGAYGVALGDGANASVANSVALGAGAVTTAGVNTAGATIGGTAYTFAGTTPVGVVSVGAPGAERQIQNVAAGQLSATSTDAVNGSQLNATNTLVTSIQNGGTKYFATNASGPGASATGQDAVAAGGNASASGDRSLALGADSFANSASSVAIGDTALAGGGKAVAIGAGNAAFGNGAVALGDPNYASGTGSFAGGADNRANSDGSATATAGNMTNGAVAIGNANIAVGQGSVALGNASIAGAAGAVALGDTAVVAATATQGVALGSGATTTVANSVALGANSTAGAANNGWAGMTIAGTTTTNNVQATAVVSVSGNGVDRQITGLADGAVTVTSRDAISGAQLFQTIMAFQTALATGGSGVGVSGGGSAIDNSAGLAPSTTAAGKNGLVLGVGGSSTGQNSVALGNGSSDGGRANVVSVGTAAAPRQIINVAAGTQALDAVNVGQLQPLVIALGGGAAIDPVTGAVTKPSFNVGGATYTTVAEALAATNKLSVQYTPDAQGNPTNAIVLSGANNGQPVSIGNVAAGSQPNDAVNYAQLSAVDARVDLLQSGLSSLSGQVTRLRRDALGGIAGVAAMANLAYGATPGKFSTAASVGGYKGYAGLAAGVQYIAPDSSIRFRASMSYTPVTKDVTWGGSVGVEF